ncbi:MAG: hypothetical protein B7Z60_10185 [Ferrovum sp. 37-45-19]|nr:MAG: hypothetical protein B7Z60_10185 [Ferrovum sp. 37-45-19]
MSESVEGTWLALPGRAPHRFPHAVRHKYMDVNYLEFMHELAGLEYKPGQAFYPSDHEKAWAAKERSKIHGKVILWSLAGSAVHKTWPYLDEVIARLMLQHRDVQVFLTGGPECAILETGWEAEPRVHRKCGVWSIRETLAFVQTVDMVIGPETGILNAAAFMDMPKVITLSHSSVENLTRDWVNTISLTPRNTDCYPCHQLHYNFQFCRKDEAIGVAACQSDIPADDMYKAIEQCLVPAQLHSA